MALTCVVFLCVVATVIGGPVLLQEKDQRILPISRKELGEQVVAVEAPKPYQFGYELEDGLGMSQYRSEASDGSGTVKGSYGYLDPFGVYRKVEYTADTNGYRAVIRSNEPGTANQDVADAMFIVEAPPPAVLEMAALKGAPVLVPQRK